MAVLGASLLFLLPTDWEQREFTLRWSDAARIDWGTIVLFGTGIIFGSLLESTGLAETIGNGSYDTLGLTSTFAITVFAVILAILISETTSNTRLGRGRRTHHHPDRDGRRRQPVRAGAGRDLRGVLRLHAAGVDATERDRLRLRRRCPITKMIRSGFTFDILGAILIIILLPLMVLVLGLGG